MNSKDYAENGHLSYRHKISGFRFSVSFFNILLTKKLTISVNSLDFERVIMTASRRTLQFLQNFLFS